MTETETPKLGEWWIRNDGGTIAYVCGFDLDGDPVWIDANEELHNSMTIFFTEEFHHEPRCTSFDWVEPPDDWVTQDRVPARPGIDERSYADDTTLTLWEDASNIHWNVPAMHGMVIGETTLQLRCRRKDLPVTVPATKRVPVRLWTMNDVIYHKSRWTVTTAQSDAEVSKNMVEILNDEKGFFVEVPE